MNTKRILSWGSFIIIVILIVWGLIAAANKARVEDGATAKADEVNSQDWVSSTSTVPVTIIEYSDFQCPACVSYFPTLEKLISENKDKVRLVYRHFPLPQHGNAVPAAIASEAAGKQGKFWEMYRMLFDNQANWESSKDAKTIFTSYAEKIGLDMVMYKVDIESKEMQDNVNADIKSGVKAGINSTPTFYINGKKTVTTNIYEDFKKLIDDAAVATQTP